MNVSPNVDLDELRRGQEVLLNEALNVVDALEFESVGEIVALKEVLEDGERALVIGHTDEERVVRLAEPLLRHHRAVGRRAAAGTPLRLRLRADPQVRGRGARARRGPGHRLRQIGGLGNQIEQIRDAVELPYLHAELFQEHELRPPKGVLLTARPDAARR